MKRKVPYIFLLALCVLFSACRKNPLPPDEKEEPVFYIKCEANGVPVSVEAGKEDYYMFSSHFQNQNNVYVYKGELKQKSCGSGCGYQIAILINDAKVSALNGPMKPDSALFVGTYGFNDGSPEPILYKGMFTPIDQGSYSWTYSDGATSTAQNGLHYFKARKDYTVGLNVNGPCVSMHENNFRPGSALTTIITGSNDPSGTPMTYTFYSSNANPAITNTWDFGDTTALVTSNNPVVHTYVNEGYKSVKLTSTLGAETLTSFYRVAAFPFPVCAGNYNSVFIPEQNVFALGAITFQVTDPSGNVYTTESLNQTADSKVEIVSVQDYELNSEGQPTKKLKIRFNCTVKGSSGTLNVKNGEAVIAVSYK